MINYTRSKEYNLKQKPLNPADKVSLSGRKTEVELQPKIQSVNQTPGQAQSTLHAKSQPYDEIQHLTTIYQQLNRNRQIQFLNYLEKSLNDSAWRRKGSGVPPKTAEANRAKLHDDINDTCKQELSEIMDDDIFNDGEGLSEQFKSSATDLFLQQLQTRINEETAFKQGVQELLETLSPHAFNPVNTISAMEQYALKIIELENLHVEAVEEITELKREIEQQINEEAFFTTLTGVKERRPRRSVVAETMEEVSEDNAFLNHNEKQYASPLIKQYLESGWSK